MNQGKSINKSNKRNQIMKCTVVGILVFSMVFSLFATLLAMVL